MKKLTRFIGLCAFSFVLQAQAGLIPVTVGSDNMLYDDVLDITWLADASMGGQNSWLGAVDWADGLSFGGYEDWRLPSVDVNGDGAIVVCDGSNSLACQDNELGYMFYENLSEYGPGFEGPNVIVGHLFSGYWSGTEFSVPGFTYSPEAWGYSNGELRFQDKSGSAGALSLWAVRDGDVRVAVPEPGTLALISLGLIGLVTQRKRTI